MAKYKLEEIFDLQMGKTPSRNNLEYWNTCDNKWISIGDLSQAGKYISDTKEYLSNSAVEESKIKVIPANTVVMSFKLSIGKTAITSEDMYSNEAIMAFHDKHVIELMPEYMYYMFKYKSWDEGTNKAVMGKTLNKAILSKVEGFFSLSGSVRLAGFFCLADCFLAGLCSIAFAIFSVTHGSSSSKSSS